MITKTSSKQKLAQLRELMQQFDADYYYVPGTDPHRNEYVPEHWQRRHWISDFSGSSGDVLVGLQQAYLLTDPRYFLQAEQELDPSSYQVIKSTQALFPQLLQWLAEQADGFCFAVDPQLISIQQVEQLQAQILAKKAKLLLLSENLIDKLWQKERPSLLTTPIKFYDVCYAGRPANDKIADIQKLIIEHNTEALVINDLADIAWLFNIRGQDIDYNPLVIARAIITNKAAHLFIEPQRFNQTLESCCTQHPYQDFADKLGQFTGNIWLDPHHCSEWIKQHLSPQASPYYQDGPIAAMKAIKNSTEITGIKRAHINDAIALTRFFYWLENHWKNGVSELSAAKQLNTFRLENPRCVDLSFTTISGFAANGAVIHYSVNEKTNISIDDSSLYLVDSGGQYLEGTTDVTRTIHLGTPTQEQKQHYTLVLKGHLHLRQCIFPHGTCGEHLNAIAHLPLWQHYLDYGHGTGHGVGCYSCVHESPPRISAAISKAALLPGMVVSNEPGVYFSNQYGIRIENLCLVVLAAQQAQSATKHGPFYGFEDLTLFPYCQALIDKNLLNTQEIKAINDYHQRVYETIAPELEETHLKEWLQTATRAL